MSSGSLIDLLHGYLNVAVDRQQVITANMANVDTPGYHARDINFQAALTQAMNNEATGQQIEPASIEVEDLPERPDGNNVNIDRESMLLSETQLQYQMGVALIKDQFQTLLTAINKE
jgi:flagellar basal-body rod protein FlgB